MTILQKIGMYLLCIPVGIVLGVFLAAFLDKITDELKVYRATGSYDGIVALCLAFLAVCCGIVGITCFIISHIISL
jgi:hypothetical protein